MSTLINIIQSIVNDLVIPPIDWSAPGSADGACVSVHGRSVTSSLCSCLQVQPTLHMPQHEIQNLSIWQNKH